LQERALCLHYRWRAGDACLIGQIAFDVAGNLYSTDSGNQRVRRIDAVSGIIRTIAGNGTAGYAGADFGASRLTTITRVAAFLSAGCAGYLGVLVPPAAYADSATMSQRVVL
jgi:hypothetical protein